MTDAPPATSGGSATRPALPVCASTEPCAEPFAIAEVGFEIDVFEKRPAIALPVDARLDIGLTYGSVGQGPNAKSRALHSVSVTYAGDIEVFERDIAAPLRAAVSMPPQTWLAFERKADLRTHAMEYHSVILRQPLLVTSADIASARAAERSKVELVFGETPARNRTNELKAYAVEVVLADAAAARLAAWTEKHPEYPLATLVHGRVVEEGRTAGRSKELWLDLGWLAPQDTPAAAEKLAKEIQERSARK